MTAPRIEETADGVILPVRVQPGARRSGVTGLRDGALKVAVTQPPEKGKANDAVIDVLCEALKLRGSQIELRSPAASRQKKFVIRGIAAAELLRRVQSALGPAS